MRWPDFAAHPIGANLLVIAAGAAVVWVAGVRITRWANALADRTGIGKAAVGVVLLAVVATAITAGDVLVGGVVGGWALALAVLYGMAVVRLVAGYAVARAGGAVAEQSGLGAGFVGATLVAATTSLPELSTTIEAVRLRQYALAFSDIFGTNLLNVALIFVTDLAAPGPPVLAGEGRFALFGALLGVVLTSVYVVGLLERRDRTVWRLGIDSALVLLAYAGGVAVLWTLR